MKRALFILLIMVITVNAAFPQEVEDNEKLQQSGNQEDNESSPSPQPSPPRGEGVLTDESLMPHGNTEKHEIPSTPRGEGVLTDESLMPHGDTEKHEIPSTPRGEGVLKDESHIPHQDSKEYENPSPLGGEGKGEGDTEDVADTEGEQVSPSGDVEEEQLYTLTAELTPILQVIDLDTGSSKAREFRILKEGLYIDNLLLYYGTQNQEFRSEAVNVAPLNNFMEDGYGVVNYRRFGLLDIGISVHKFPHDYANDAKTLFYLENPYTYSLQASATEASPFDVSTQRDNNSIGFKFTPGDKLIISTNVSVEERNGRRPLTVESFANIDESATAIIEIAEPLDYTTTTIDIGMEYADDTVNIQLNNNLQVFSNNLPDEVLWENPYQPQPDNRYSKGKIKTAGDYTVHTLSIRPSIRLTEGTRLINNLSYSSITSSMTLVPFSNNPAYTGEGFLRNKLESDVRSLTLSSILTMRPVSQLRLNVKYRYNTYENDTPEIESTPPYVMIDGSSTEYIRTPRYMSYNMKTMELDGTWDITDRLYFKAGMKNNDTFRSQREVDKENQKVYTLSINSRISQKFYGRIGYEHTIRRGDYDPTYYLEIYDPDSSVYQDPLMRSFDLSGRDSDTVTATLDYSLSETLSLGSTLSFTSGKHPNVIIGRKQSSGESASVYIQYMPLTDILLYSHYFHENQEINGSYKWTLDSGPFTETIKDNANVYVIGFSHDIGDRLSISANYSKYDSEGTSTNLPRVSSATDVYDLKASYRACRGFYSTGCPPFMFKDIKVDIGYYVEDYRREDYALDNFPGPPDTTDMLDIDNPDIFLGIREPGYRLNIFSTSISFYF